MLSMEPTAIARLSIDVIKLAILRWVTAGEFQAPSAQKEGDLGAWKG
jgi:hypothetical protein